MHVLRMAADVWALDKQMRADRVHDSFIHSLHQLMNATQKVMSLLRSTESAVRTFQRARLWREAPQQFKGARPQVVLLVVIQYDAKRVCFIGHIHAQSQCRASGGREPPLHKVGRRLKVATPSM